MASVLETLLEQSLRFEYLTGDVSHIVQPHTTEWRVLTGLMCSQIHRGGGLIHLTDGSLIRARAGDLMVLPAGTPHKIDLATPAGLTRWAHVNYYILDRLDLFSLLDVPCVIPPALGPKIGDAIQEWVEFVKAPGPKDAFALAAKRNEFGFKMLGLLSGACRPKPRAFQTLARIQDLRAVLEHIHAHFAQALDRDRLAGIACLSAAQFHRVFREATGTTPVRYLRHVRLRHAQQLLISTRRPVAEIARGVGYEDAFVFSKLFRRVSGVGPREYRKRTMELGEVASAGQQLPPWRS
jgi:AraC-like DNA-binding protein